MAKMIFFGIFCFAVLGQVAFARDLAEAINVDIRNQLSVYQDLLQKDDSTHKEDLKKLIETMEGALKTESLEEKQNILKNIQQNFTPEFNKYVSEKVEEFQLNTSLQDAVTFYNSFTTAHPEFKGEIEKTVATLESLLKETDLKKKAEGFATLDKDFSPEFKSFLKNNALPNVNRELQKTSEFFDNLLAGNEGKFETEIKQLKAEAEAALDDKLTVDDKQKALFKVTNPENRELFEYLQMKFIVSN